MDERKSPPNLRIAQSCKPTAWMLGILFQPGANCLDDKQVGQPGYDGFSA
jgi:hypothetical protein